MLRLDFRASFFGENMNLLNYVSTPQETVDEFREALASPQMHHNNEMEKRHFKKMTDSGHKPYICFLILGRSPKSGFILLGGDLSCEDGYAQGYLDTFQIRRAELKNHLRTYPALIYIIYEDIPEVRVRPDFIFLDDDDLKYYQVPYSPKPLDFLN